MSYNLLKQQYVYNEQSAARIINSNRKIEEKMKELVHIYQAAGTNPKTDALRPEFVEGILNGNSEVESTAAPSPVIKKNDPAAAGAVSFAKPPEEILEEAKEEAAKILEDARSRADQMIADANEKAQELYESQKDIGYRDGAAAIEEELQKKLLEMEAQSQSQREALEQEYCEKMSVMEGDLVEAIIKVFNRVFHIQFEEKQEILLHLINNTLCSVNPEKRYRILVSNEDLAFVEAHLPELNAQLGEDVTLEVARDPKLAESECQIETDNGIYDCGVDEELSGLCKDIRSLCSE